MEEKCELEEAENDSRLNSQRWEHQHKSTMEKSHLLSDELTIERKSNRYEYFYFFPTLQCKRDLDRVFFLHRIGNILSLIHI